MRAWGSWAGDVVLSALVRKIWGARQPQGATTLPSLAPSLTVRPRMPGPVT